LDSIGLAPLLPARFFSVSENNRNTETAACWFGMQMVHELGHALAAWCNGATVERIALLPISRTDTSEYPLFVYGAGLCQR